MANLHCVIDDKIKERIDTYIEATWSRKHGRITQVVEEALGDFLKKEGY